MIEMLAYKSNRKMSFISVDFIGLIEKITS